MVLVGFMASGKSSVGPLLAHRLGWRVVDIDAEIVRREGRPVAGIFADRGEAAFRRLEADLVREFLGHDDVVVIPGGGWAAAGPARLTGVPPATFTAWLRVGAAEAVRRARASSETRPLLAGPDPQATASALLAEREPFYAPAQLHLDAESASPDELAAAIVSQMQSRPPTS